MPPYVTQTLLEPQLSPPPCSIPDKPGSTDSRSPDTGSYRDVDRIATRVESGHAPPAPSPLGTSSPRLSLSLALERPAMHITIPSSTFEFAVSPHTPGSPDTAILEQHPARHAPCTAPLSPRSSCESQAARASGRRNSDHSNSTPSSPSKSPLRRILALHSGPFPEMQQASQYLHATFTIPSRRQTLYTACAIVLHLLSVICIAWFAISWFRFYSFDVARADLITVLRYMLLVLAPLSLWCLPALCALSATLAWPHVSALSFDPPADSHPDANSSISFSIPSKPNPLDTAVSSTASDAYTVAAASEDLLHDAATPRFGFMISTDPQNNIRDGAAAAPHPSTSPPLPLSPKDFADACIQGAHCVAESLTGRSSAEHRRPLLPATRPSGTGRSGRGSTGCCAQTSTILTVWLRHEFYLAALCTVAGYGTLAVALLDREVFGRASGIEIVACTTAHLQRMARVGGTVMFLLYSLLLTTGCVCAMLALCCTLLLHRQRARCTRSVSACAC